MDQGSHLIRIELTVHIWATYSSNLSHGSLTIRISHMGRLQFKVRIWVACSSKFVFGSLRVRSSYLGRLQFEVHMGRHIIKWAKLIFDARHYDPYVQGHKGYNGVRKNSTWPISLFGDPYSRQFPHQSPPYRYFIISYFRSMPMFIRKIFRALRAQN